VWWTGAPRRTGPAILFLALLALDGLATSLPVTVGLNPAGAHWNWIGKVLSVAWALAYVRIARVPPERVGLTWRQLRGSVLPATLFTLLLLAISALLLRESQRPDAETLLYQATLPGMAEELAYRGVLLELLERAFGAREEGWRGGAAWAGAVTALAFGLWHGLAWSGGHVTFDVSAFFFPALGGIAFWWLRRRTGSLAFPIVAHNGANLATFVWAMLSH
jgi:membrane protease YdiL (CAAX protease family)